MSSSHTLARPLNGPDYEDFSAIGRSLHFEDFLTCWKRRALVPHPIKSRPQYVPRSLQVLWFAPAKKPTEHNFYGNVTFAISFAKVRARLGEKFYYIDQSVYNTHVVTRIILSRNNLTYETVDFNDFNTGSPMVRGTPSNWHHAARCNSAASRYNQSKPHELEIGLHVTSEDCVWFFRNCTIHANNHSNANSGSHHVCHRYNTFGRTCPYSLTNEVTVALLRTWLERLLRQGNGSVDPAALFRKVLANTVTRFGGAGEDSLLMMMSDLRL